MRTMGAVAEVTRVCQADLDGDGTDETIVEVADPPAPPSGKAPRTDACAVLLATPSDISVVDGFLRVPGSTVEHQRCASLSHIIDLDGDGKLEVVTCAVEEDRDSGGKWFVSGGAASVYVWDAAKLRRVLVSQDRFLMARTGGELRATEIQRVVTEHQRELQRCYDREILLHPGLERKMVFEWDIELDGGVSSVRLVSPTTAATSGMEACATAHIRTWRFPHPLGGRVKSIWYPFVFRQVSVPGAR